MNIETSLRKRKTLNKRCPYCESSQIRKRKFLNNWICQHCQQTFTDPASDV